MKRKIGLSLLFILVNLVLGAISFNEYLKIKDRISNVELDQKALVGSTQRMYDIEFKNWETAHEKTVSKLLKILGVDGAYDFNNTLVDKNSLNKFFNYRTYVKTDLLLENPEGIKRINPHAPSKVKKGGESPAIVIGKYVLMASHVNDAENFSKEIIRIPLQGGVLEAHIELKVLEYKVVVLLPNGKDLALKEVYRNREKDFSLFEMPVPQKDLNFPFKIGDTSQIKVGHFVYLNGRPSQTLYEIARSGFITALLSAGQKDGTLKEDSNEFSISQSTDNGDSGSPVIGFRDGKPELIGIYLGWVGDSYDNGKNTRSRAIKINVVIDEVKKNLGIDLRELQRKILFST